MNGILRYRKAAYLLCGLLTAIPTLVWAGTSSATMQIKVTVLAPPCVINDNQPITVEFNEVLTNQVNGRNFRMPVNYTLSCANGPYNTMRLQIKGNSASFDSTVLLTNQNGLGIELQQGSTKLPINTWLNFIHPNKPELWAVPVKQSGATLTGGIFEAAATMKVDYQ